MPEGFSNGPGSQPSDGEANFLEPLAACTLTKSGPAPKLTLRSGADRREPEGAMIRFACPGCSSTFSVDDGKAGKSGKCPKCGAAFIIPQAEGAAPPPLPPAPVPAPAPMSPPLPATDPNAPVEIDPCPKCQTKLSVAVSDLGNDVECPYCKTVFASTRAGTRPPAPPPPAPGRKSSADLDFEGKPKPRRDRDRDDVEDEDRPRRRRRDEDDEDERPSKRRGSRRDDEDDEDRPSRRGGRPPVSRRADDDDDEDRPRRRSRRDDDDDDDYDDRPRRRSRSRRRSGGSGERSGAVTAASVMTIIVGALWLIGAGMIFFGSAYIFSMIGGLPRGVGNAQARDAAQSALFGATMCCGIPTLLMAILHISGGIFALQRKTAGRIIVIICASLALLLGLFSLYGTFRLFFLMPVTPPFEFVLYQMVSLLMTLGYGIFAMIVMCRSDYADEFD
jgi:hypothetical protein